MPSFDRPYPSQYPQERRERRPRRPRWEADDRGAWASRDFGDREELRGRDPFEPREYYERFEEEPYDPREHRARSLPRGRQQDLGREDLRDPVLEPQVLHRGRGDHDAVDVAGIEDPHALVQTPRDVDQPQKIGRAHV